MSQLPGLVAVLGAVVAALRGRPALAGALVGVVALVELPFVVPAAAVLAFIGLRDGRRSLARAAAAMGLVWLAAMLFMSVRGELGGYVDSTRLNAS